MCKSVRGAAYFGSSIHLAFSFIFLLWFVFDTLISEININLWKCEPPEQKFSEIDPWAHYLNLLFKLLYFTGLFVTGIYIFRGVERENPLLLKYAALVFVILQVLGVILFSIFFSLQWNAEPTEPEPQLLSDFETARLVVDEGVPTTIDIPPPSVSNLENGENVEEGLENQGISPVTPVIHETVLVAPDINDTTTTTTPMPPPTPPKSDDVTTTTTTTTTTPVPVVHPPGPCNAPECPHARLPPPVKPPRKLPHNQLVRLVLQMCFAVTNGLVSVAYVIVLALYMLKL